MGQSTLLLVFLVALVIAIVSAEPEADSDPWYGYRYGGYRGYYGRPYGYGYGYYGGYYGHPYTYGYGYRYLGKRSADAEPEADAEAKPRYYSGYYGYPYAYRPYGYGYRGYYYG